MLRSLVGSEMCIRDRHKDIKKILEKGKRVAYGARALIKGGYQSRPKMSFPGGLLVGDNAGTLNFPKIKGTHTAMKSGMIAAETIYEALQNDSVGEDLISYEEKFTNSWVDKELHKARNWGPFLHNGLKWGFKGLLGVALAAIDQFKTETAVMVPTHFVRLLALPDEIKQKYDVSSMRLAAHTGAKCPVDVMRSMIEWWGPIFRDAYGASEVGTVCAITSEEWLKHEGSVGRTIPPFSAVVLDEDFNVLPASTEGRLFFRDATGRGIIYPNDPEKTASANPEPGLFTLGEIGYIDDDGYVFITDRFSDMVVSGGVNIYPAEAEQILIEHPSTREP